MQSALAAALSYQRRGWSVVPCGPDKRPLIAWRRYQAQRATEAELRRWWGRWPRAAVAVVTGAVSGIVVLDLDRGHGNGADGLESVRTAGLELPATRCVRTPSGGLHCYNRHPGGRVPNATGILPGVDLRGDGGYVLAPPSRTPAGEYRAIEATCHEGYADLPAWTHDARRSTVVRARPASEWAGLWAAPCPEGQRNATCARLAGHLAGHGIGEQEAAALLEVWATTRCCPPLDLAEVARTVASVYRVRARQHEPLPAPVAQAAAVQAWYRLPAPMR